ncbi:MAG: hypothetical protein ACRCVU_04965 [Flavobacterium sp.]
MAIPKTKLEKAGFKLVNKGSEIRAPKWQRRLGKYKVLSFYGKGNFVLDIYELDIIFVHKAQIRITTKDPEEAVSIAKKVH